MSVATDENRKVVERFFEQVLGQGRMDVFDELIAPDYVFQATHVAVPLDRDGHRAFIIGFREAFPDWREAVTSIVADGDQVVTRQTGTGTQTGAFMGIPPTGRSVSMNSVNFDRVAGGQIRERWMMADGLSLLQQLGVVPPLS